MWASAASAGARGTGALCPSWRCRRTSGTRSSCSGRQTSARRVPAGAHRSASVRIGFSPARTSRRPRQRIQQAQRRRIAPGPARAACSCGYSPKHRIPAGRHTALARRELTQGASAGGGRAWYVRSKPLQGRHQVSDASSTMSRGAWRSSARSNCSSLVSTLTSPGRHCRPRAHQAPQPRFGPLFAARQGRHAPTKRALPARQSRARQRCQKLSRMLAGKAS